MRRKIKFQKKRDDTKKKGGERERKRREGENERFLFYFLLPDLFLAFQRRFFLLFDVECKKRKEKEGSGRTPLFFALPPP